MSTRANIAIVVAVLIAAVAYLSVFTVKETQYGVKFKFGEIVRSDYEPGIHFKLPWERVRKYDNRILTLDTQPERFLTSEQKYVEVDFFVKWYIQDVKEFYNATGGQESSAENRLLEILKSGLKNEFANRTLREVVSAERSEIMDVMTRKANELSEEFGVHIQDVRVKQVEMPTEVTERVYERMRSERKQVATRIRAEGGERAEEIRSDADRQKTVLIAEAREKAEELRGEGDALATSIYGEAYRQEPEFYSFYRSLGAYRDSLGTDDDVFVIGPESEFFKYFKQSRQQ